MSTDLPYKLERPQIGLIDLEDDQIRAKPSQAHNIRICVFETAGVVAFAFKAAFQYLLEFEITFENENSGKLRIDESKPSGRAGGVQALV
jgi:hypothetical protein